MCFFIGLLLGCGLEVSLSYANNSRLSIIKVRIASTEQGNKNKEAAIFTAASSALFFHNPSIPLRFDLRRSLHVEKTHQQRFYITQIE